MEIYAKFNPLKVKKVLDYFLPLNQANLDFDLKSPPVDLLAAQSKEKNGLLHIGTVLMNPVKAQFITTSIKVKLRTYEDFSDDQDEECLAEDVDKQNHTLYVEIPIIASVVNYTNLFSTMDPKFKGIDY